MIGFGFARLRVAVRCSLVGIANGVGGVLGMMGVGAVIELIKGVDVEG